MAQVNDPNNLYTRLRISNPLNFNQPTQQELFNRQFQENTPLQKELETRLDSVYRLSPNSEADSNIVDSAAVFMDLFDMDHEQALGLARTTFSAGLTNEARERMGFGQALGQTALNTFNQFSAGTNMAFYMIGGNDEHKAKALEKQSKIVNLWEDYGFLGNTVLSSIQPLGSSLRYMGTTALLRGGSALLARAIGVSHPILATATFIAGAGLSFLANISITGLSQAGSDFLEYSQMADKNGTKLDLDSPEAKTLFWTSALVHGTIESIGSELLPGVRYLNKTIDSVARNAILKESWRQVLLRVALGMPVGIIGEGFEEFLAVYNTALTENSLKYLANKEGATFDYTSGREMVTEGWKAFTDGAVSMIIPSILTGALGGGVYNARTSAAARANFNKTEGSVSIDRRYIEDVPKPTAPKEGEVQKPAAEREKLDPVKLVDVGGTTPKLVALNAAEREKLGEAAARNAEAVEAVIVEQEPLSVEDRQSLVNRAALATGGKLSGERIVYETKDDLEMAKILLDPVSTQGDTVTFRDEDGELVSLDLVLAEEGMDITEADISYYEDPEAPHSLARMTQDKALEYQERKLIKDAIGNVVEHTGGRISNTDLEANVDAVKMVAETLNIPTDELLGKGVAFRLVDKVYDATGSEVSARGSIESNISIEGKKQYTINISKTADATTILHELGHTLRGLATEEQIRDFRLFYGKGKEAAFIGDINKVGEKFYVGEQAFDTLEQAQKLVEANEEAFANDFVAYLRTGQAPTADLKNIFARMKAVLNRFLVEFGYRLDPEVRQAFDNLLRRESEGLPYTGTIPADAEGNVLFQSFVRRTETENGMSRSGYAMMVRAEEADTVHHYGPN
ncbi:MAG: hypothetical protein PHH86_09510, partial [Sphaerochaetaceae bacterium]|nr:hypothetical protein [Sphaerochaetaceae bacterium]